MCVCVCVCAWVCVCVCVNVYVCVAGRCVCGGRVHVSVCMCVYVGVCVCVHHVCVHVCVHDFVNEYSSTTGSPKLRRLYGSCTSSSAATWVTEVSDWHVDKTSGVGTKLSGP